MHRWFQQPRTHVEKNQPAGPCKSVVRANAREFSTALCGQFPIDLPSHLQIADGKGSGPNSPLDVPLLGRSTCEYQLARAGPCKLASPPRYCVEVCSSELKNSSQSRCAGTIHVLPPAWADHTKFHSCGNDDRRSSLSHSSSGGALSSPLMYPAVTIST